MTDSAVQLQPCPFCGHAALTAVMLDADAAVYAIACPECRAAGPKANCEFAHAVQARNSPFDEQ